jgi:uncharacterized protein (DUF924 family)
MSARATLASAMTAQNAESFDMTAHATKGAMSYDDVLTFWFGALDETGRSDQAHMARWWKKDPAFDQELRDRFGALHAAITRGEHADWIESARGRLATILVLDQFSRNMFRGAPGMFASDARALELTVDGLDRGMDQELTPAERQFFYMPLMHSEDLAAQERCVELFATFAENQKFAVQHRDIVKRFGRFPHRNEILGRTSTPEEIAFLTQPGSSF